jgi:hypothetical protein
MNTPQLPSTRGTHITACGTLRPVFVRKVELCRQWVEDVLESAGGEDVFSRDINEVENRSRDGFIPFTDGGFDGLASASMNYAHGSGQVPNAIQPYLESALKDIEAEWDKEHPDKPVAWLYADDSGQLTLPGVPPSTERDHWREKFYEHQDANMSEGGTYFYKVRVLFHGDQHSSVSGEPEAYFMVGINTDFEYGRDYISWLSCYGQSPHCTKWLWEKTVKVKNLTPKRIESLTRQAIKALSEA